MINWINNAQMRVGLQLFMGKIFHLSNRLLYKWWKFVLISNTAVMRNVLVVVPSLMIFVTDFFFLVMVVIGWNFIVRISNRKLGSVWSLLYIIWIIAIKGYFLFSGKLDDWVIIWTFSGLLIYDQWLINLSLWIKYKREFPMPVSELFLFLTTNLYFSKQHCVQHFLRWH